MVKKKKEHIDLFNLAGQTLYLKGVIKLDNTGNFTKKVLEKFEKYPHKTLNIDLDGLEDIDSSGVVSIYYLEKKAKEKKIDTFIIGGSSEIKKKLDLFKTSKKATPQATDKKGLMEGVGETAKNIYKNYFLEFMQLTANVFYWSFNDIFNKGARRKGETVNQAVLIGVNAVLIVGAMAFIIGLVLALQSANQLRNFGADVYIVDLIVLAMMSEMGPLITAILVAGRSGSSIAAEIATMKVTAELDALRTMGLNPVRFVVVPKMYGCLLTLPILTLIANMLGIAGGMVTAYMNLGLTPEVFINRMGESLYNKDIITGIAKSFVFAAIIVLTGSFYGFNADKGAEGVGKVTTTSVVVAISLVIVADSIMGLIFY
jgi:phospholipid/cholesterol/gamma-HCH transport system permease protein